MTACPNFVWKDLTDKHPNNCTLPKFVASHSQSSFDWKNTTHVARVPEDIDAIKNRFDGELQVHGSHGLVQTLIAHNLVDEYRLFVVPVVLGTGKRLFDSLPAPVAFELVGARRLSRGVTYNVYRSTGEFSTGSFGFAR